MKLWNLVKGKCVHTTKLASSADQVKFEPQNSKYALVIDKEVSKYDKNWSFQTYTNLAPEWEFW